MFCVAKEEGIQVEVPVLRVWQWAFCALWSWNGCLDISNNVGIAISQTIILLITIFMGGIPTIKNGWFMTLLYIKIRIHQMILEFNQGDYGDYGDQSQVTILRVPQSIAPPPFATQAIKPTNLWWKKMAVAAACFRCYTERLLTPSRCYEYLWMYMMNYYESNTWVIMNYEWIIMNINAI